MSKLTDAINVIMAFAKTDPKALGETAADVDILNKAEAALASAGLEGASTVEDRWTAGNVHVPASKEEIKTGPTQEASGAGAEKMVREYSQPAPQHGVTEIADKFERGLRIVASSMKAQTDAIQLLIESQKSMAATLLKASTVVKADEDEEDEEEDESEVVEIKESKAKAVSLFKKATALLKQAKSFGDEAEIEDDEATKKALVTKSKLFRKRAAELLSKARSNAIIGNDDATLKSILKAAKKADIDVVQEEEEEDEEDEEAKAKAKGADAAGNQADKIDPASGNQADAAKSKQVDEAIAVAKKAEETVAAVLAGVQTLNGTVAGMMSVIGGMSRSSLTVQPVVKADPAPESPDFDKQIALARATGTLTEAGARTARDIIEKGELAKAGHFDVSTIPALIMKASPEVKTILAGYKIEKAA